MEFLAQGHYHCFLQLGAVPHLQDNFKLFRLAVKTFAQLVNSIDHLVVGCINRDAETGRIGIGIVVRLTFIEVIVLV
jgi:hypothetical protein